MSVSFEVNGNGVEHIPMHEFTERAYREYSMYVILDRALPHISDGLKPVQRRIIYAMWELGLKAELKFKKSARTVGDVLGKFHPHGDSACYEAMVLMAQDFSFRYPIINGQGNWGSQDDPKSFAAMRYTEAKLSLYAEVLLEELGQGTVEWQANFDGTLKEPETLPAMIPNILLNGATGIAVGMGCDIPPHNIGEVAKACIHLIDRPDARVREICRFIKGPDFPSGAEIITPESDIIDIYERGRGSIRMRASYFFDNGNLVINALPYQVSGAKVIEQIASQMQAKKLPMVSDIRDEADHEDPVRLVIVPRSARVDRDALMGHLFATTDLEKSFRVNLNIIGLNGRPKVMDLAYLLNEWLLYRKQVVTNRLNYRLEKVESRLHILDGLLIAYLNIDEVIHIIRNEDKPGFVLRKRFSLSEKQSEAILNLKLRNLAKLEEEKILEEKKTLEMERGELEKILGSSEEMKKLMKNEIKKVAKKHGDKRKSPIVQGKEAKAFDTTEISPVEPVTVVLSNNGWIRAAKGHDLDVEKLGYKPGDALKAFAKGRSNQLAVFMDSVGRSYTLPAGQLPSARGYGEPVSGSLNLPKGAVLETVLMGDEDRDLFLAGDSGYGFISKLGSLFTKNRNGKAILKLSPGALPMPVMEIGDPDHDLIVAVSSQGRMLVFPVTKLPRLSSGKGNKIIQIPSAKAKSREEFVSFLQILKPGHDLVVYAGKRHLTLKPGTLEDYKGERGRRGRKLPRGFQNVTLLETPSPQ